MNPRTAANHSADPSDDEATEGGKTFQTLDNLYSQDNQSFSYSLDDGLESKTETGTVQSGYSKIYNVKHQDNIEVPLGAAAIATSNIATSTENKGHPDDGKIRREHIAPAGKLGVVIDTTKYGPVVHDVKSGSPLEGVLFRGDRIVSIDDEDTSTLTASAVTKIMARKMTAHKVKLL